MTSNFSYFEKAISNFLSRFPIFKAIIKTFYLNFVYLFHKKNAKFITNYDHSSIFYPGESFFGYYDKSPVNVSGLVLCHLSISPTYELPDSTNSIEVALFSPDLLTKLWSAKTNAYNWQQGARLHWLNDSLFIYNDFDAVRQTYVSKVVCSENFEQLREFEFSVQDSFGTDYFLSLNYRRLNALRPDYGYRNLPNLSEDDLNCLANDGIWKVDYITGKAFLLISLDNICDFAPKDVFADALHKVNHIFISPDGSKFIFFHRYIMDKRRFDRLLLADSQSGELKLLSDHGMVSHCFWVDNKTIFGYLRGPENIDAYWLIDVQTGVFTHFDALDGLGDGHPHVYGDMVVSDTYPDKSRMQHLNLVNLQTGELTKLAEFFHGFNFSGETRCDLHPRFSPCGKFIFFDSVFSGKRRLYRLSLKNI